MRLETKLIAAATAAMLCTNLIAQTVTVPASAVGGNTAAKIGITALSSSDVVSLIRSSSADGTIPRPWTAADIDRKRIADNITLTCSVPATVGFSTGPIREVYNGFSFDSTCKSKNTWGATGTFNVTLRHPSTITVELVHPNPNIAAPKTIISDGYANNEYYNENYVASTSTQICYAGTCYNGEDKYRNHITVYYDPAVGMTATADLDCTFLTNDSRVHTESPLGGIRTVCTALYQDTYSPAYGKQ